MAHYADKTDVPVERSRAEIERLIIRYGATSTAFFNSADCAMIVFEAKGRRILFRLPLPAQDDKRFTHYRHSSGRLLPRVSAEAVRTAWEQGCRQRWRALALVIKAKLEAVESGITTFEDEFLAHIVMPDGETVSHHIKPRIASIYESGEMRPLLPPPRAA